MGLQANWLPISAGSHAFQNDLCEQLHRCQRIVVAEQKAYSQQLPDPRRFNFLVFTTHLRFIESNSLGTNHPNSSSPLYTFIITLGA